MRNWNAFNISELNLSIKSLNYFYKTFTDLKWIMTTVINWRNQTEIRSMVDTSFRNGSSKLHKQLAVFTEHINSVKSLSAPSDL